MYGPPKHRQRYTFGTAINVSATRGAGHLSHSALQDFARRYASTYSSADPYKHIVIDNLVPEALAHACMKELQAKKGGGYELPPWMQPGAAGAEGMPPGCTVM